MPAHAVKGIIGAYDLPPEARVSRLDECRLKQKVGYGQDADPLPHELCEACLMLGRSPNALDMVDFAPRCTFPIDRCTSQGLRRVPRLSEEPG